MGEDMKKAKKPVLPERTTNIIGNIKAPKPLLDDIDAEKIRRLEENPDDKASDQRIILEWLREYRGLEYEIRGKGGPRKHLERYENHE